MLVKLDDHSTPVPPRLPLTNPPRAEDKVDFLILGAGWTAGFLIPYLRAHTALTSRSTTRAGGGEFDSLPFTFNPSSSDLSPFRALPNARTIIISFPIAEPGASECLLTSYARTRQTASGVGGLETVDVIQLGSSGIFDGGPTLHARPEEGIGDKSEVRQVWIDRHSDYDRQNARARSEDELLGLNDRALGGPGGTVFRTTVVNLSGLWGKTRSIRNYVSRVAPTKPALGAKTSIHMVHGLDVARALVAVGGAFERAAGQRWIVTDMRVYDWWDLAAAWGQSLEKGRDTEATIGPQAQWVNELMAEHGIRALPRSPNTLGRALDSREFWTTFGLTPIRARLEHAE